MGQTPPFGMYAWNCLVAMLEEVHSKIPAVAIQDKVGDLAQRVEHNVGLLQPTMPPCLSLKGSKSEG